MKQDHNIPSGLSLDFFTEEDLRAASADGRPRLRLVIIGAGAMGQEHIWTAQRGGQAIVHGIYDPNPGSVNSSAKWFADFDEVRKYDSLESACRDAEADAFVISTPNYTHLEIVRTVLTAGKPILLEKPVTTTARDAWELVQLAESSQPPIFVGLEYRQKCVYLEALDELYMRQSIGRTRMIHILEHRAPFLNKVGQWNKFSDLSGGTLIEKCCHYFDLFNICAGPDATPAKVYASGGMAVNFIDFEFRGRRSDIIDHAFVVVDYDNGVRACLNLCMFSYGEGASEELIVNGDGGRIRAIDHPKPFLEVWRRGNRPSYRAEVSFPHHVAETGNHGGSTVLEHELFFDVVRGNTRDFPTVRDGFWSVIIGEAGERSIKEGAPILISDILQEIGIPDLRRSSR